MTRSLFALLALTVAIPLGAASCNFPQCGAGTVQQQQADGSLKCIQASAPAPLIQCDNVDGGSSEIIGGRCVSHLKCDPATTTTDPVTGICVGTGGGTVMCPCPVQDANHICVHGNFYDFVTSKPITAALHDGVYDPLAFVANPSAPAIAEDLNNTKGCYVFSGFPAPGTGLVAVAVQDAAGAPSTYFFSGSGAQVVNGKSYQIDVYVVPKTAVAAWSASAGIDYDAKGAYIAMYFDDKVPDPTLLDITKDTHPVAGVKLQDNNATPTSVKYLGPTRDKLDPTLTATSAVGIAIIPSPPQIDNQSGLGGMCGMPPLACKWETHPGASAAHVMFIDRFHSCAGSTAATCM